MLNFAVEKVQWAGYVVGREGIQANPKKLATISDFPAPTNITELRRFMGMVEQVASFSSTVKTEATPLRPLLSTAYPFIWTSDQDSAFEKVKQALVSPL